MDNLSEILASNILKLRRKRELSQAALASIADLPRSTLTNMESGSGNPSLQNLIKISSAFQVSVEELLSFPRNVKLGLKMISFFFISDETHPFAKFSRHL